MFQKFIVLTLREANIDIKELNDLPKLEVIEISFEKGKENLDKYLNGGFFRALEEISVIKQEIEKEIRKEVILKIN